MDTQTHTQQRDTEADTRQRLLEAAGEVFADHGFHHATVREICRRAGANVAAVNYHFRDKESLYAEVLKWAGQVALQRYPIPVPAQGVTPEERLRAYVRNYLDRILDEGRPAWHGKLMSREMVSPTKALDELAEHFVRPQYARLCGIVKDLIEADGGPTADEETVRRCCHSVVGQCLFLKLCRPMIERITPQQGYGASDRPAIAEHINTSSLALIAAARGRLLASQRGEARS